MSNNKELAYYLTELYRGIKITEEQINKIKDLEFNVGDQRFTIISTIDAVLKTVPDDAKLVVKEVEVVPTGYFQYSISFLTDADVKLAEEDPEFKEKSKKLQNLFKLLGSAGASLGSGVAIPGGGTAFPLKFKSVSEDHGDLHAALDELEVIGTVVDLIARIEQHEFNINGGSNPSSPILGNPRRTSALTKYIEKLEALYLSDLK